MNKVNDDVLFFFRAGMLWLASAFCELVISPPDEGWEHVLGCLPRPFYRS